MARKAKGPGYTPPSGKSPAFKNMGSTSPLYKAGLTKEERKEKREKLVKDIQQFGKGLEGSLKDVKHALVSDDAKEAMIEKGYETKSTRKDKYGTTSYDPNFTDELGYGRVEPEVEPEVVAEEVMGPNEKTLNEINNTEKENFGIKPDFTIGQAFKQATKMGAQIGDIFNIGDEQFRYEFEDKDYNPTKKPPTTKKSAFKMKNSPAKNYKKGYYGA